MITVRRRTAGTVKSFTPSFYFIQPQAFVPEELVRSEGAHPYGRIPVGNGAETDAAFWVGYQFANSFEVCFDGFEGAIHTTANSFCF